jgi:hypothetical protein
MYRTIARLLMSAFEMCFKLLKVIKKIKSIKAKFYNIQQYTFNL